MKTQRESKIDLNYAIILVIASGTCGFTLAFFVKDWAGYSIDKIVSIEVDPTGLISLVITILLTFYVTRTLSKKNDQEKLLKEVLIGMVIDSKKELQTKFGVIVNNIKNNNDFSLFDITADCKVFRTKIYTMIEMAECVDLIKEPDEIANKIKEAGNEIWSILTGDYVSIGDNKVRYEEEMIRKVEQKIAEIDKGIILLIRKISNQ